MNNRGQFFAVYLVLITLAMCIAGLAMYSYQMKIIDNSIISPAEVLRLEDGKDIFEIKEEAELQKILKESLSEKSKENFVKEFEESNTSLWIFENISINGIKADSSAFDSVEERENFLASLYDFSFDGTSYQLTRKSFEKYYRFKAKERGKIDFSTDLVWKIPEKNI